jgi:hypothetical protein
MGDRCGVLCPEAAEKIFLYGSRIRLFFFLRWLCRQNVYRVIVRRVDIRLGRWHGHLNDVPFVARLDLVITFLAPRNVAVLNR